MSLFGNKIEAAQARITSLVALIASTGFKIDADAATIPTAEAFAAHLKTNQATAIAEAVKAKDGELAGAKAEITAIRAGFAGAGIKLGEFAAADFTAKEGETITPAAAAVKSALETAITQRAVRQVAGAGHTAAIEVPAGDTPNAAADQSVPPATAAEFKANCDAIKDPAARTTYFRKHKAKFIK